MSYGLPTTNDGAHDRRNYYGDSRAIPDRQRRPTDEDCARDHRRSFSDFRGAQGSAYSPEDRPSTRRSCDGFRSLDIIDRDELVQVRGYQVGSRISEHLFASLGSALDQRERARERRESDRLFMENALLLSMRDFGLC